jgi:hypothetical protein
LRSRVSASLIFQTIWFDSGDFSNFENDPALVQQTIRVDLTHRELGLDVGRPRRGRAARQWSAMTLLRDRPIRMPRPDELACREPCGVPRCDCGRWRELAWETPWICRVCRHLVSSGEHVFGMVGNGLAHAWHYDQETRELLTYQDDALEHVDDDGDDSELNNDEDPPLD